MKENAVCEHTPQKSYPGVPFLENLWCFNLLGKQTGCADPQDQGVLCLVVFLLGRAGDIAFLGGFFIEEKHTIIDVIGDHSRNWVLCALLA